MKRELLLLRHGKAALDIGVDDFHRPLKKRGKLAAERIGLWLLEQHLLPDYFLASPAERAITTARRVCKTAGLDKHDIVQDGRLYLASGEQLLALLQEVPPAIRRVLLVGHNPGLEELLCSLAVQMPPPRTDGKLLPTAALARLGFDQEWAGLTSHCASLFALVRPFANQIKSSEINDYSIEYRFPETIGD